MKILFTCGRQLEYTRNQSLYDAFRTIAEVTAVTSSKKNYLLRHLDLFYKLAKARPNSYDVVFVGFFGQLIVPVVRLMTKKPIVFDAFISTYQTLCFDRKKVKPGSIIGRTAYFIDKLACRMANVIILDTDAHINYFVKTYKLPKSKFKRVFVGANESLFAPQAASPNAKPLVFTYSEYQPLHGMEHIIRAAKKLEGVADFQIVGKGMERAKIDSLLQELQVKNVQLIDWVPYAELPGHIAQADICLGGHFGGTEKANMVIAGKTFQFVSMKKPTIVGDNAANRELFQSVDAAFVPPADADSLAEKIKELLAQPKLRHEISENQFKEFQAKASSGALRKVLAG